MKIEEAIEQGRQTLAAVSATPSLDSEVLLCHIVQQHESSWLHAHSDEQLTKKQQEKWIEILERRTAGEPVAYLTGSAIFFGRSFEVNADVLVPRSDTEVLIDQALEIADRLSVAAPTIADIGTGSGCIAITLALELPQAQIIATDISTEALAVARRNAKAHDVLDRIKFMEGDMLVPIITTKVDLIVSNPPYVPSAEVDAASKQHDTVGLTYEPRGALDGGPDGQKYVSKIIASGVPAVIETINGAIIRSSC